MAQKKLGWDPNRVQKMFKFCIELTELSMCGH